MRILLGCVVGIIISWHGLAQSQTTPYCTDLTAEEAAKVVAAKNYWNETHGTSIDAETFVKKTIWRVTRDLLKLQAEGTAKKDFNSTIQSVVEEVDAAFGETESVMP